MSKKNGAFHKTLDFLAGKGFYLILALCVTAIGVSGYMLLFGGDKGEPEPDPQLNWVSPPAYSSSPSASPSQNTPPSSVRPSQSMTLPEPPPDDSVDVIAPASDMPVVSPTSLPTPTTPIPVPTPKASPSPAAKTPPDFFWPVNGTVLTPHAPEDLVYNVTMGDWRVHSGIDIETELGAHVTAAADGKVIYIGEDERMGTVVILGHTGGYMTKYYGLQTVATVIMDQKVSAGDVIGGVGDTAQWESGLHAHLHFEVWKDKTQVDPIEVLPKK